MLFRSNLGIKQPIANILSAVKEHKANAVGMSGLLVKSTVVMRENLEEMTREGVDVPVLLGGAALTRSYVERDLREVYDGRVFYGRDAFEGLYTLDKLMELKRSGTDDPDFGRIPSGRSLAERRGPKETAVDLPRRSPEVVSDNKVFTPPLPPGDIRIGMSQNVPKMHFVCQPSSGCGHCGITASPRGMGCVGQVALRGSCSTGFSSMPISGCPVSRSRM